MKTIRIIILSAIAAIATNCAPKGDGACEATTTDASDTLRSVRPQELKNAISLISDDWMLLAAGEEGDFNEMTISWGEMGELWGKPVFTVFVDTTRFTHKYLTRSDYFSVSGFAPTYKDDLQFLGTHSGRDGDKLSETRLHPAFTSKGTPYFKEATVVIECRKIYANDFDCGKMCGGMEEFYAKRGSVHTVFIGEIVNVWTK